MAVQRWVFEDPVTAESHEFEINPKDGGSENLEKTMSYVNTSAPNGRVLAFEGRDKAQEGEFSGVIFTEDEYNDLTDWFDKRNQIFMTDDLNRTNSIYITKFTRKRVRSYLKPWKHEYTVNYLIIDWE